MDWLLRAGTFVCLRQDCPKDAAPAHPCTRCEMPWVDKGTRALIQLWQRCRVRQALPQGGGILDQPERLMAGFDVIDQVVAHYQKKEREQMKLELQVQQHGR